MKRLFLLSILAVGATVFQLCVHAAAPQYNVLFVAIDDLRPDLGCYGHPIVKSPNIDRFAASSLQFNRAYCQFALCNPSRSSLLSGRRPETIKVYDLGTFVRKNSPDLVTLPQLFRENGYETRSYGKIYHTGHGNKDDKLSWSKPPWHSAKDDPAAAKTTTAPVKKPKPADANSKKKADDHADEFPYGAPDVPDEKLLDGQVASRAVAALRELKDNKFFLAVGFHKPHLPFVAPKKYWDLYDPKQLKLAPNPFHPKDAPEFANNDASELRRYKGVPKKGPISDEEARKLIHGYYASTSYVDAQLGKVLAELDALGLREKTVIILWGDHGYQLGEHTTWNKRTNWETATRVPMLISTPRQKTAGQKTDALVEFVDVYPTLAELCGLPAPVGLEGTSFVPLLENASRAWKKAAFSVYTRDVSGLGNVFGRAMRTDRYRFIEWTAANGKTFFELYDHHGDSAENVNIASHPENKELVAALSKQLHAGWKTAVPSK